MRARFHAEPIVQATELLLQERTPRDVAVARPRAEEVKAAANVRELVPPMLRRFHSPHDPMPRTHLLSNGRYAVMLTARRLRIQPLARPRGHALARGRHLRSPGARYVFLRDARSGEVWSAGYQPSGVEPDSYEVAFSEDRAEIVRRDGTITTTLEVAVSPEDDAEVRRVSITNLGSRAREIELTSYAEIVLAPPPPTRRTRRSPSCSCRRSSSPTSARSWPRGGGGRRASPRSGRRTSPSWKARPWATCNSRPTGRASSGAGASIRTPISVIDGRPLSNTVGTVLDPIFSLRCRVRMPPGATARVAFWTLVAPSRSEALDLADKHHDSTAFERAVTLAWTQAQVQLHHLGIGPDEAHLFQRLANHVLYSDPTLRPSSEVLEAQRARAVDALGARHLGRPADRAGADRRGRGSGDRPPAAARPRVLADEAARRRSGDPERAARRPTRRISRAPSRRSCGRASRAAQPDGRGRARQRVRPARRSDLARGAQPAAERGARGAPQPPRQPRRAGQAHRRNPSRALARALRRVARRAPASDRRRDAAPPRPELEFFNGLGGFAADGREYVTLLGEGQWTPAPWINVIANPSFGFQVSVEGAGYTWSVNSRENQLTPWSNDPVGDRPGEVIYVRDEDSGALWGPTALPIREEAVAVRRADTARATAASSTPRTASRSSCCSTCRSTTRSRSRG